MDPDAALEDLPEDLLSRIVVRLGGLGLALNLTAGKNRGRNNSKN